MVSDSCVSDGDRRYPGRKVWRVKGALIGFAGNEADSFRFLDWYRGGMAGKFHFGESSALILSPGKLEVYDANYAKPVPVPQGRGAIGTGAKAAMCTWEAMRWQDPRKVVRIVCKHDACSLGPVRVYRL